MRFFVATRGSLTALGLFVAFAAGCEIISGLNNIQPNDSAAATTGASSAGSGGTTAQSTVASSTAPSSATASTGSSMGGGGAGGMMPMCTPQNVVQKCGADTACKKFSCPMGTCATTNEAKGTMCQDATHTCDGNGNCVAAGCADGVQDGDETDVDCGGSCPPCPNSDGCKQAQDCQSGFCPMIKNANMEPGTCKPCAQDTDCGNGNYCNKSSNCAAKLAQGKPCTGSDQCTSGFCVAGPQQNEGSVCCDNACPSNDLAHGCESCFNKETGKPDGTCAATKQGSDWWNLCMPYQCDGTNTACPTTCKMDGDCCGGSGCYCDGAMHCQQAKASGMACTAADQCSGMGCTAADQCKTSYCVDMFCCSVASCPGQKCTGPMGTCQ